MRVGLILAAAGLFAGPALAADQPVYAPPADWVKTQAIPKAVPAPANAPVQVLLVDRQTRLSPAEDDYFVETATKILSPQGLSSAGTVAAVWDPDTETLVIHSLKLIRGDTTIDLLAGGKKFLVLRRESNLELAMLDGRLTATIEPEGLQVGDIVYAAFTTERRDPALGGHSTGFDQLRHPGVASHVVMRTLWPAGEPVRWRVTDGVGQPTVVKSGAGEEVVADLHDVEMPKPPVGAPARFQELGAMEFSDFADWPALSKLMSPLYAKAETLGAGSPLKAEIAKIAAASPDPKARALAALRLVEDQTRYVFLGMNDGGLVPADADVTWARRFGDCKGKTTLLVALLKGLGIDAEPALISTTAGDGMDQRLPSPSWFDHVMVRAQIAGKTYWLDGTRLGDRSLDQLQIPRFGWALPVRAAGAELVKLDPPPFDQPSLAETLTIDASKGADTPAPTHLEQQFRGDYAAALRARLASVPRDDFERALRESWSKAYPWLDIATVKIAEEGPDGTASVTADGAGKLEWSTASDGTRLYRVPGTAMGAETSFKRQPGPQIDAPYLVPYPYYATFTRRITLPADGDFTLIGADVDQTIAGQALKRRSRIENGVLVIETSDKAVAPEFPASEADAAGASLRDLARKDVAVDYRVRAAGAPAASSKSASLDADLTAARKGDAGAEYRVGAAYLRGAGLPFDAKAGADWLRKSAAAGDVKGEATLGAMLALAAAPTPDQAAEGAGWLRKAAEAGDAHAAAQLGWLYASGHGLARDDAQALVWLRKAAAGGDGPGELYLGALYLDGHGVAQDAATGAGWLRKAADQGVASAEAELARCYAIGRGVPRDAAQTAFWARKAADQGDPFGELLLGAAYESGQGADRDLAQAFDLYSKAAEKGLPNAQMQLARVYDSGLGAVARDPAKSLDWTRKAADKGFAPGEYALGSLYRTGRGAAAQDYAQALVWLGKAAAQGDAAAQNDLASMYEAGQGTPRDDGQVRDWLGKAAAQGYLPAMVHLGLIYENPGMGAAPDYAKAAEWLTRAATAGDRVAEFHLGLLYDRGEGVAHDPAAAAHWYQLAAAKGYSAAQSRLAELHLPPAPPAPPPLNIAPVQAANVAPAANQAKR